jgi:hypothetical protein
MLGDTCTFKVTPVVDPTNQAPVDAYEIPDTARADLPPSVTTPQSPPDQDPRQLGRPTTLAGDLPLARSYGTLYLVDHTGTRRLPNAA